jgi:hypothetical protein
MLKLGLLNVNTSAAGLSTQQSWKNACNKPGPCYPWYSLLKTVTDKFACNIFHVYFIFNLHVEWSYVVMIFWDGVWIYWLSGYKQPIAWLAMGWQSFTVKNVCYATLNKASFTLRCILWNWLRSRLKDMTPWRCVGSGGIAPLFLYRGSRWSWVVSFIPQLLCLWGKSHGTHWIGGWSLSAGLDVVAFLWGKSPATHWIGG